MERVTFLIEQTGERIGCMLNPESLVVRRLSGVRKLSSINGIFVGAEQSDDLLLFTGGGLTELRFQLLFDVSIAGSSVKATDIRELTGPLWRLAENVQQAEGNPGPSPVRFIWGKSWNILGVITAIAERFDRFTPEGLPQRSWITLRFVRINESTRKTEEPQHDLDRIYQLIENERTVTFQWIEEKASLESVIEETTSALLPRLDLVAFKRFGSAAYWRIVAAANNIWDIFDVSVDINLRVRFQIGAGRRE